VFSLPYQSDKCSFMTNRNGASRTILEFPVNDGFASAPKKLAISCM